MDVPPHRDWPIWQMMDSAFPTGAFAHSNGLEGAFQNGFVTNGSELRLFLEASLEQIGYSTFPLLIAAHSEPERLSELDELCHAWTTNHIANRASRLLGRSLLAAVERCLAFARPKAAMTPLRYGHLAPIFGCVFQQSGATRLTMLSWFMFSHIRGLVAAAVRLNIVGIFEGQRIQHALSPQCEQILQSCQDLTLNDLAQSSPLLDLWQGTQDRLVSRLFQS